jgi:hypothetical protein
VRPRELLPRSAATLLGGLLGGILGTSGMILVGVAAEAAAGLSLTRWLPQLELGFGGPLAGAGILGTDFSLPAHYVHGTVLGLVFAGLLLFGERVRIAPRIPPWESGLAFGAVVAGIVLLLLRATVSIALTPGLVGLVLLLHLTFGALAGILVQWVSPQSIPGALPAARG